MPEQMTRDELVEMVEDLQSTVEDLQAFHDWYMNHEKGRVDDLEQELAEERAARQSLEQTVSEQGTRLETIVGVGEDEQSNPEKRIADLRDALIRQAQANTNRQEASMHTGEVKKLFASLGHTGKNGKVYSQWRQDAMEDAAEAEGFRMDTKQKDGREVKAVVVNLDALPGHEASNDIITSGEGNTGQQHANSD